MTQSTPSHTGSVFIGCHMEEEYEEEDEIDTGPSGIG